MLGKATRRHDSARAHSAAPSPDRSPPHRQPSLPDTARLLAEQATTGFPEISLMVPHQDIAVMSPVPEPEGSLHMSSFRAGAQQVRQAWGGRELPLGPLVDADVLGDQLGRVAGGGADLGDAGVPRV
jgi:hypothetical protein